MDQFPKQTIKIALNCKSAFPVMQNNTRRGKQQAQGKRGMYRKMYDESKTRFLIYSKEEEKKKIKQRF